MPTIAKAIRERKTLANNLKIFSDRANQNAIFVHGEKVDFNCVEYVEKFIEEQAKLRDLKTKTVEVSLNTKIELPYNLGTVPLYKAVLIRDDLKSQRQLIQSLVNLPVKERRYNRITGLDDSITKERAFNFDEYLTKIDLLQEQIDAIDAAIQYYDNTVNI